MLEFAAGLRNDKIVTAHGRFDINVNYVFYIKFLVIKPAPVRKICWIIIFYGFFSKVFLVNGSMNLNGWMASFMRMVLPIVQTWIVLERIKKPDLSVPRCERIGCKGIVKPDIVFFGVVSSIFWLPKTKL